MINDINQSCEILKLSGVLQCYESIANECGKIKASYTEYLDQVLKYELMVKEQRARETTLKMAGFPILKTLEMFDYTNSNINQMQVQELANLQFVKNKENIIFIGSPGTGKTHLAISLGYLATQSWLRVRFITMADLLLQLEAAQYQRRLVSLPQENHRR